ncbi:molybdopterin cofactor synthesis protein a [Holotrichia oblita]|nr:molybdopterin cofactor synthesis protein a [Holotrichia oblita]
MPEVKTTTVSNENMLTFEEALRLCNVFVSLGVKNIKITGGEPLMRKGVPEFIGALKHNECLEKITLTTNGLLLEKNFSALINAGMDSVNLSLDTLNPKIYQAITGYNAHESVINALYTCIKNNMPVKINCVPIEGVNGGELADIAILARESVEAVRFIELMPIGAANKYSYIGSEKIKAVLEEQFGLLTPYAKAYGSGPAEYFSIKGFKGRIGFINAMSGGFYERCNRVRLTSDGWLKLCLSHNAGVDLKEPLRSGATDCELSEIITQAVWQKPLGHCFNQNSVETAMHMIGG